MFVKDMGHVSAAELNQQLNKVYRWELNLKQISESDAANMIKTLHSKMTNIKSSGGAHRAERNPEYMEAVMVSSVLESWKNEMAHNRRIIAEHYRAIDEYCTQTLTERELTDKEMSKREHFAKALKSKKGDFKKRYGKRGEEVMYATATKMAKNESYQLPPALPHWLLEGEIEQARVTMAARDLADSVQDLVEKIGKMQNEQLPAIVSAMKDEMSMEQAEQFNQTVSAALTTLIQAANGARDTLDNASRNNYGGEQQMGEPQPGQEMAAPAPEAPQGGEAGMPPREQESELDTADVAAGGQAELGRGRR
jgi:uncharacterized protein involved in tolerance to divalent cations